MEHLDSAKTIVRVIMLYFSCLLCVTVMYLPTVTCFTFFAQDCSHPAAIKVLSLRKLCQATTSDKVPLKPHADLIEHAVFIKQETLAVASHFCHATRQEWDAACGVWGHVKRIQEPFQAQEQTVSADECSRMISQGKVHIHTADKTYAYKIQVGRTLNVRLYTHGRVQVKDGKVSCVGEDVVRGEEMLYGRLEEVHYSFYIGMDELQFDVNTNVGRVASTGDLLPKLCSPRSTNCITSKGTYVWTVSSYCPWLLVRKFKGHTVTFPGTNDIYVMSEDDQKILLGREDEAPVPSECPHLSQSYYTNYPSLILAKYSRSVDDFPKVDTSNVDPLLSLRVRDDFYSVKLYELIAKARSDGAIDFCKGQVGLLEAMRGVTYQIGDSLTPAPSLGSHSFLRYQGEAVTWYTCHSIIVAARSLTGKEKTKCYRQLPVNHGTTPMWLSPNTRVLRTTGTEMKCNAFDHPYFETVGGDWVTLSNGTVQLVKVPLASDSLSELLANKTSAVGAVTFLGPGGMFSEKQQADWKHYLLTGFSREDILDFMQDQAKPQADDEATIETSPMAISHYEWVNTLKDWGYSQFPDILGNFLLALKYTSYLVSVCVWLMGLVGIGWSMWWLVRKASDTILCWPCRMLRRIEHKIAVETLNSERQLSERERRRSSGRSYVENRQAIELEEI